MGKTKNKSRSEIEYLRGLVRKLKAENKYLKQRVQPDLEEIDDPVDPETRVCPNCGKGVFQEFDFVFAILRKCNVCGLQEKIKKNGSKD